MRQTKCFEGKIQSQISFLYITSNSLLSFTNFYVLDPFYDLFCSYYYSLSIFPVLFCKNALLNSNIDRIGLHIMPRTSNIMTNCSLEQTKDMHDLCQIFLAFSQQIERPNILYELMQFRNFLRLNA